MGRGVMGIWLLIFLFEVVMGIWALVFCSKGVTGIWTFFAFDTDTHISLAHTGASQRGVLHRGRQMGRTPAHPIQPNPSNQPSEPNKPNTCMATGGEWLLLLLIQADDPLLVFLTKLTMAFFKLHKTFGSSSEVIR